MEKKEVIQIIEGILKTNFQRVVHITLNNKRFYNGYILNFNESSISMVDRKLGEMDILYSQIINVEPFMKG